MAKENKNRTEDFGNPIENIEDETFECKFCEFITTNLEELDEHIVTDHEEQYLQEQDDVEPTDSKIQHVIVPGEPTVQDQKISKLTKKSYSIDEDMGGPSIYVCPYCDLQSERRNYMLNHIEIEHQKNGEKFIYRCSVCIYQTHRKNDMPKHLLTHCTEGLVEMFFCAFCTYKTKRKNDLPRHMLCHRKGSDLYACPHCDYSTCRQGDLMKHSYVHRGFQNSFDKLHNCTECGYSARRANDLNRHAILHSELICGNIYKCKKCFYGTSISKSFAKHILSNCVSKDDFVQLVQEVAVMEEYPDNCLTEQELGNKKSTVYLMQDEYHTPKEVMKVAETTES